MAQSSSVGTTISPSRFANILLPERPKSFRLKLYLNCLIKNKILDLNIEIVCLITRSDIYFSDIDCLLHQISWWAIR
ncbi:Os11g0694150 [Oryza sativa Japonica Group]|uniref:Os11g0694150 protein n=1 Tax=Oryza sativa subsp. japonica TaxID=39947 RepID=A0A0N7KTD8_ORYSJ|nr:Os11g0694150 [Oryza sativa Japonica Group]